MPKFKVAVAEGSVADSTWIDGLARDMNMELVIGSVKTVDDIRKLTEGCDALMVTLHKMDAEKIASLPMSIKCIARMGVGLDTIDLEAAVAAKIAVIFQPNYAIDEVANHAFAMMMALHRGLFSANEIVHENNWGIATQVGEITSLQDATVGVVGCGRIGQAIIERLQPFVKRVVGFDVAAPANLHGVEMVSNLDELLTQSQLVTLHAPYLPSTHHMIDAEQMSLMPKGAILVNVSRGGLINEEALADALESGHLSGAGLDVFQTEPLPINSILRNTKNLIMSPHIAWYSRSSGPRLSKWSIEDLFTFLTEQRITEGSFAVGPFQSREED